MAKEPLTGLAVGRSDHELPFQLSLIATTPDLFSVLPTATQLADDAHETPSNSLAISPLGVGVD